MLFRVNTYVRFTEEEVHAFVAWHAQEFPHSFSLRPAELLSITWRVSYADRGWVGLEAEGYAINIPYEGACVCLTKI